jgi:hypothetical protein
MTQENLEDLSPPFVPASAMSRAHAEEIRTQQIVADNGQIVLGGNGDSKLPLIPGYTTEDGAGSDGDDTIHETIRFYDVPNCVGANLTSTSGVSIMDEPEKVDLVYNAFVEDWILMALEYLGEKRQKSDAKSAINGKTLTDVLRDWVQANWPCEKDED